ncbi:MAG: AAA family ATPase [Nostoc sp. JL31]|uniref:AAA family ATPase n=1 Tax=Nostoc sp. JL31 TaxID=2815395 RepID=UPI003457A81F|nr:AAA family ATPase [Nostoc sp. JL31]
MLKLDYPSTQELTRYKQEYEITRSLNLQGVIKAYSQQEYQRTLVILLEDFGGESLEQWMHKCPETFSPMPLSTFLRLAIDITDILGRIHAANVIHKDINPGNIVLNPHRGVVKIIDFGIATRFNRTNPTFKSHYALEGTLLYLSPEQTGRMNRLLDYRTDFYSLGVTFYELLTGQLPFPTTDILELVHCHIAKQPPPPHELNVTIAKAVSNIIMKLMAKNAEDRYQSAWGIKADLEICAEQLTEVGEIDNIQLGLQDIRDRFQIPQKLYGRDKEVAMLVATFERVAASRNHAENISEQEQNSNSTFPVEMMLVSGYAGIGKSALVQEIYKPITQKRGYFISGKFDQFQRNIPYSAIADALQKLMQQLLGEADEQVQQWRSRLLAALGTNGQIIIDVIPEVELIIGKQPPAPEVGATEAQNRFNRIFQSFVRVFCDKSHPLVIFLDDLQWIDSATLKLIELMLLDEQIQSLFLIGAYRDNEVNSTHPLALMLERLRKQGVVFQEIILTPLTLELLNQLIAETLHQNTDNVHSLAELVLRKTEGNPFFVNEFLRMLYSENLLTFDLPQSPSPLGKGGQRGVGGWQWNIARIQAQNITDNVVELMLVKLNKLPKSTQQIIRLAACIGAEFDLDVLSIVCDKSPQLVFLDLLAALQNGLIQPLSELDENLLIKEHKFLHDRVQQAAYALIDEAHKQVVHLQIGHNLLEKTLPEQLSERIFEIVDHLNHGIELITEQSGRNEIARLNLIAGQKAKAAIAIQNAKLYSKLRASESQMAQFLEAVPVGIGVVDALGRPCYANQQVIQLLGKGIIPDATPEQLAEIYQLYLAGTEQPYPIENLPVMQALKGDRTRIDDLEIRQNNAIIPVEGWGTPVFDEQGNVIYAISAFQDITERKQAEQLLADYNRTLEQQVAQLTAALQASEAALRHREQELRLITDALPVCICYIDTDKHYRFVNRTYEDWYGYSRDKILGKQVWEVMSETAYQIIEPYINQALAGQITTYEAKSLCR